MIITVKIEEADGWIQAHAYSVNDPDRVVLCPPPREPFDGFDSGEDLLDAIYACAVKYDHRIASITLRHGEPLEVPRALAVKS